MNKSVKETQEIKLPPKKHKILIEVNAQAYAKWKEYRNQNYLKSSEALIVDLIDTKLNSQKMPVLRKTVHASPHSQNMNKIVKMRAGGVCQAVGCTNTLNTEVDHIIPLALGGKTELKNLRLLCRAHNQARNLGFIV